MKAQETIERIYYSHQTGATKPFDDAVPRTLLEKKVDTYLKESVALERLWHTPVTAHTLTREIERIESGTRMPGRLEEIYSALGYDPFVIAECLARPLLVNRLARSFFASDPRFHGAARDEAERLHASLIRDGMRLFEADPRKSEVDVRRSTNPVQPTASAEARGGYEVLELGPEEFAKWRANAPKRVGQIGDIEELKDSFVIRTVREEHEGHVRLASFSIPKRSWDEWWEAVSRNFDGQSVVAVGGEMPDPSRHGDEHLTDDTWENGSLASVPATRFGGHTAVWTGSLMLVWGGGDFLGTGGRYDPVTDSWTPISTLDSPEGRGDHTAIWTGTEMIVWGGLSRDLEYLDTGGRYNPATDTWTSVVTEGAPLGRSFHSAIWTGREMVVWGGSHVGRYLKTGGRYDPTTDTWVATSSARVKPRARHASVWTGTEMIVWGGVVSRNGADATPSSGDRYDPATDSWTRVSQHSAPPGRQLHTAVWTGDRMVVWGGNGDLGAVQSGGQYDPVTDTWARTSTADAPSARAAHTAVWTGSRMIVWGGTQRSGYGGEGGSYDPLSDSWSTLATVDAPVRRYDHVAVWSGDLMIVWGGSSGDLSGIGNTGGRYDPSSDTWTPTSIGDGPSPRSILTSVWTGNRMVVWGGYDDEFTLRQLNSGGQYDPVTDSWTETTMRGAPSKRERHTAVWTGDRMVVWGGLSNESLGTGASYDPSADRWTATSTSGAPEGRYEHTALWTGTEMIVWGGFAYPFEVNTGAAYDPSADTWRPLSISNAPTPRRVHSAVWTGTRMLVWGGYGSAEGFVDTGGAYDPVSDSWTATATANAPAPRWLHTTVWTGTQMLVWGGSNQSSTLDSGSRYDLLTDSWASMSLAGSPTARELHRAVWTGNLMVVWGGRTSFHSLNTGARYDPATDSWTPTSTVGAAEQRYWHAAVWTGDSMIVWGGAEALSTGGRYVVAPPANE